MERGWSGGERFELHYAATEWFRFSLLCGDTFVVEIGIHKFVSKR